MVLEGKMTTKLEELKHIVRNRVVSARYCIKKARQYDLMHGYLHLYLDYANNDLKIVEDYLKKEQQAKNHLSLCGGIRLGVEE